MHVVNNASEAATFEFLTLAKEQGIRNVLVVRRSSLIAYRYPYKGIQASYEANEASQDKIGDGSPTALVYFIRMRFGDHFGIAVAGNSVYDAVVPSDGADFGSIWQEASAADGGLDALMSSVDAGADMILTQSYYDFDVYKEFYQKCMGYGIQVPIVPSVMPVESLEQIRRAGQLTQCRIPPALTKLLEDAGQSEVMVRAAGEKWTTEQIRQCRSFGAPCVHIFTINQEALTCSIASTIAGKKLSRSAIGASKNRRSEEVRPVFWSNRHHSYMTRTAHLDEVPDGRWGSSTLDYGGFDKAVTGTSSERRALWGEEVKSVKDVQDTFVKYLTGKITRLPWSQSALAAETDPLIATLVRLNEVGLLTINSQPVMNGVPSEDAVHGWGPPGGLIYQKAYLEFFAPPEWIDAIKETLGKRKHATFHAVNKQGQSLSNCTNVCAVTWGAFPGREIVQPTVVDPASFMVWKDEAFALWKIHWADSYGEAHGSSKKIIESIHDTYWLVNVVDHNYVDSASGGIFAMMEDVIARYEADAEMES